MDTYEQLSTGDFVFIHMRDDLNVEPDGPILRVGHISAIGVDFFGEPMIALDDGYPPLYLEHTAAISNHGRTAVPA